MIVESLEAEALDIESLEIESLDVDRSLAAEGVETPSTVPAEMPSEAEATTAPDAVETCEQVAEVSATEMPESAPAMPALETATPETAALETSSQVDAVERGPAELTFRDLPLMEPLLAALDAEGYQVPTPIQARTIPLLLAGRDVLGQAQTGTGKTAAFALPLLQQIDLSTRQPQVLVMAPTRELAIQVAKAFTRYAAQLNGLRVAAVYGGQDIVPQLRQLERGVHVIVGTPGRIMDHMRRGSLKLDALRTLVLDEADEMLRMGFAEDVEWVLTQAPASRQTALFSATMPAPIRRIAQQHLTDPETVTIAQKTATADTVRQRFVIAAGRHKQEALARILEAEAIDGVIVFVKTKISGEPLCEFLGNRGHRAAVLNGDVAQKQRERIVELFRSGKLDVLVATDVAARGLDVQRVSHVFNYDLPFDSEAYVHRIGRTGRAGRSGEAILFVHPRERGLLKRLEHATRQKIEPMEVPSNRTINKQRVARFHERIVAAMADPQVSKYASILEQFQREHEAPLEQVAAALAMLAQGDVPLLLSDNFSSGGSRERGPRESAHREEGPHRHERGESSHGSRGRRNEGLEPFRIEIGHLHQVKPGNIVGAIAVEAGLDSGQIGRIEIYHEHSVVDLPEGMPREIFRKLKSVCIFGQPLNITRLADSTSPSPNDTKRPAKRPFRKPGFEKPPRAADDSATRFEKRPKGKRPGKAERKKLAAKR